MWELFKVAWDLGVLRDGIRKGQLGWRKLLFAIGFALLEYAIAVPAALLYAKDARYKPLFIAAMALVVVLLIAFFWIAMRWYLQSLAAQRAPVATVQTAAVQTTTDQGDA